MGFAALAAFPGAGLAQGQQDGDALIAAGNEALEAGKPGVAAQQFSRAMRSDTLSNAEIAKALLLRAAAYKADGKPALAIADLDSALWMGGLAKKDMARAYLTRGEAYQAVGMGDLANADLRRAREVDPDVAPAAPANTEVGAFATQVEIASEERSPRRESRPIRAEIPGFANLGDQQTSRPSPPPRRENTRESSQSSSSRAEEAPKPVPGFRTSIVPEERREAAPQPRAETPPPRQWTTSTSSGDDEEQTGSEGGARSTVSNFFSGLWGGGGKEDAPEPREEAAPAEQPPAQGWSQSTRVANAERAPAPPRPAAEAPAGNTASDGSGSYRIQLASLRTEEEAQEAWRRLSSRHGDLLAGQQHVIEKTTVGNLGTFYRIQIGPYADKAESAQLCKSLQGSGVDCFLVAR